MRSSEGGTSGGFGRPSRRDISDCMTAREPDIAGMKARKVNQSTYIHKTQHYAALIALVIHAAHADSAEHGNNRGN